MTSRGTSQLPDLSSQQIDFLRRYLGVTVPESATTSQDSGKPDVSVNVSKRRIILERWSKVPKDLHIHVDRLREAITTAVPWEDADGIATLVGNKLDSLVDDMQEQIQDAIDKSINAGDDTYSAVVAVVGKLSKQVSSDPTIVAIADNGVIAGDSFTQAFNSAFDDLGKELST